jgi:2-C-methyl-D-erythritol 4-phosphate cytidylyltransferase
MNIAIILAGGSGLRMGSEIPKQYIEIDGQSIIGYCLAKFLIHPRIDAVIIGVAEEWRPYVENCVRDLRNLKPVYYASAGATRQETIYKALQVVTARFSDEDIVIIHDAVRPNVSTHLIGVCLDTCGEYDGAMPVLPVKDTMYQSVDGLTISSLLPRETLYAGQSPEAFRLGKYRKAHEALPYEVMLQVRGSSEIAYRQGLSIKLVAGEESNYKITVPEDLERFRLSIKA